MNKLKFTGETTIFKSDKGFYSTGISNKLMDGSWDNAYFPVQFKKGVEVENKTEINITNGFLTFYRDKNNENKPVFKIMVLDFTQVGDAAEDTATDFTDEPLPF
jgi:DNA gyrase/topoisomerase IV subunit B